LRIENQTQNITKGSAVAEERRDVPFQLKILWS